MSDLGRILVVTGLAIAALGGLIWAAGHVPWFGRLPGDIRVERENFKLYFPLTTCLLISVVVTVIITWLRKR